MYMAFWPELVICLKAETSNRIIRIRILGKIPVCSAVYGSYREYPTGLHHISQHTSPANGRMDNQPSSGIVHLNVGGVKYSTTSAVCFIVSFFLTTPFFSSTTLVPYIHPFLVSI